MIGFDVSPSRIEHIYAHIRSGFYIDIRGWWFDLTEGVSKRKSWISELSNVLVAINLNVRAAQFRNDVWESVVPNELYMYIVYRFADKYYNKQ